MRSKSFLSFFSLTLVWLLLCAGELSGAERQKAVLLLEHDQTAPWIDLLHKGLEKGARDFNFETETLIADAASDQTAVFRKAASEADLVLVATDNFHEILRDNAANFRRVKFGCLDAGIRAPNIMSVTFADEQASFLAGMACAMLMEKGGLSGVRSGSIPGWLSGADTPAMRSLINGFIEGVKLVAPETKIAQALTASFTNKDLAAQKMQWLLDSKADLVVLAAGAGNPGAIKVLEERGAWHIALDGYLSKKGAIGLIAKNTDQAVYEIMRSAASPKFAAKEIIVYDLANGGVDFELSEEISKTYAKTANDIARRIKEVKAEIIKGAIKIPSLRARTLCDCLD